MQRSAGYTSSDEAGVFLVARSSARAGFTWEDDQQSAMSSGTFQDFEGYDGEEHTDVVEEHDCWGIDF